MKGYLVFAAVVLGVAAFVAKPGDSSTADPAAPPGKEPARTVSAAPPRVSGGGGSALVLQRDASGQFHMTAQVNGEDVRFLVDTGADVVALTVADAQRIGLDADPEQFEPIGRTASGVGYGAAVRLERIDIDGHEIGDVDAVVMDGLSTNLLGQSVLRRLGRVELRGDTMVLHAPS